MFRRMIIAILIHMSLRHVSSTIVFCSSFLYKQKSVRFGDKIGLKCNHMGSSHKSICYSYGRNKGKGYFYLLEGVMKRVVNNIIYKLQVNNSLN